MELTELIIPAEPAYATSVRMLAASLAVAAGMDVDEVEDVRMAAEEAFVIACVSDCNRLSIKFGLSEAGLSMDYELDAPLKPEDPDCHLAHALLLSLCETYLIEDTVIHLNIVKL